MLQRKWKTLTLLLILMIFNSSDAYVGISIGTDIYNLESASEIVSILQSGKIKHVRLFDTNHQMLEALVNTGIEVMVSVPNDQLRVIGESQSNAEDWLNNNIIPFVPSTNIMCITVGDEVLSTVPDMAPILVPAMEHLYSALLAADLHFQIKISSPISMEMIPEPFPPSHASFNSSLSPTMHHFLEFLKNTGSSFMLNAHPSIYGLFQPVPSSKQNEDPNTLLYYSNMFDAIVDAAYCSMEALNFSKIPVVLTESRWQGAMIDNALMYDRTLIWEMLSRSGTPSRPDMPVTVYMNEEIQNGLGYGRVMYSIKFQSVSHAVTEAAGTGNFCVAIQNADTSALMAGLNWACGPGGANCSAIQEGQPCYSTNLVALASYAYNDYYQRTQATGGTCSFNNTAMLTANDPSTPTCTFTGSSGSGTNTGGGGTGAGGGGGTGTNSSTGGGTGTNSSTGGGGGGGGIVPNPSFGPTGPTSFDNGVSSLQFPKLSYIVSPLIFLLWFKM